MRLNPDKIKYLSKIIVDKLADSEDVELLQKKETVVKMLEKIITNDLQIEDSIEQEVREMLKEYSQTIRSEGLDYESLFRKAKERIIKRRGLVF